MVRACGPFACLAAGVLLLAGGARAEGDLLTLAQRGRRSAYSVVLPPKPSPCLLHAAEEFTNYVARMTGVALPVVEGAARERAVLIRSKGQRENDAFRFRAEGRDFVIEGESDRAALFGVYDFLENQCGCEWLTAYHEIVPERERLEVPATFALERRPTFKTRDCEWTEPMENPDFAAKLKLNGFHYVDTYGDRQGGRPPAFDKVLCASHSLLNVFPPAKYFKDHPEWYAEVDGVRKGEGRVQLCLTNPEVIERAVAFTLERVRKNYPAVKHYGLAPSDAFGYCTCPNCRALDEREGSPSGSLIAFVNRVAEAVEKEYPDVVIKTSAYLYTRTAPKTLTCCDNVLVNLCTDTCDLSVPLERNRYRWWRLPTMFQDDLRSWRKICRHIQIWDYAHNFCWLWHAFPSLQVLKPNYQFFADNGVTDVCIEGGHHGRHAESSEIKLWMAAHLVWDPYQPEEPLMTRFLNGYFGAAAPQARAYYEELATLQKDERKTPQMMWGKLDSPVLTDAFFERSAARWREAMEAVKGDVPREDHVRWAMNATDYTRLMRLKGEQDFAAPRFRELVEAAKRIQRDVEGERWPEKKIFSEDGKIDRLSRERIAGLAALGLKAAGKVNVDALEIPKGTLQQAPCGADRTVWVSPDGDDRGPGTADRPFRTPARAIAAARESGRSPVRVKDGTYELDAPLALGPQDGGLVVEAAPGTCPVFSAGRRIAGWRTDARGWWHADVSGLGKFSQLYVNGVRRLRPFLPRTGYFEQGGLAAPEPGTGRQRIVYRAGDVDPAWTGFGDAEFCFFHVWSMSRMPPVAADAATRTVTLAHKALGRLQLFPFGRGKLYRIENVAAALGEPGDWYCDGKGNLTYVPLPGETPDTAVAVTAHHDRLIAAVGVTNAVFRGIAFAHANWNMPRDGFHCIQAAVGMPAAIEAADCAGFRLERCTVAHVGGWAVAFGEGSRDCAVVGCHLADLGGGGVKIGGVDFKLEDSRFTCGCEVSDTLIEHGGRTDPAATGVWIGHAHHSRVAHNTIRDMYYSGVSAGWRWELGRNPAHDNVIEWNHIYDIGQEVLSDMGGIYTLGEQPGTVERFNHIHDVMTERDGNGIYFDSGSSHIAVSNNFVHDISHATWFMARISRSNLVANNVFAHSRGVMLSTPERNAASTPSTFANNILVCDDETMMATGGTGREVVFTNNLVWCTGARKPPARPGFSLLDLGSADVLARVPRLAGLEAAAARGFVPFSVAEAGCRGRPGNGLAVGEVPAVFARVRPQVSPFDEGFENPSPDARTWGLHPASATNLVRVCEGVAATGAKSLEVVNALPGWTPHFSFSPYRDSGRVTVSFAVRLERGAAFKLSMRDINLGTLAPGPTITVDASAALRAGGRRLCELPVGQWIGIELSFELGSGREKDEFTLTAKVPGETSPRVFAGLPFHHLFRKVCWIGFMSACSKGERYYIDDLKVRP